MLLNIPVSYIFLKQGAAAEITVAVAIAISLVCLAARLIMLRGMIGLSIRKFMSDVFVKILMVSVVSVIIPFLLHDEFPEGFWGFAANAVICVTVSGLAVMFIGLHSNERKELISMLKKGGKR